MNSEGSRELKSGLQAYAQVHTARVLTQMDRDPDSPTFGCFDRNYWHYKIRDYPSSLLQQGLHTIEALRNGVMPGLAQRGQLSSWSLGAVNALARQIDRRGGVDEYYPYERSYPSAAFGLYAIGCVVWDWQQSGSDLLGRVNWPPLRRLAKHLASRLETQASNQQAAALAGLALASKISQLEIEPRTVEAIAARFFASQHPEGWFDEYGGPDFGYLTVTIDALIDYFDATGDPHATQAVDRAIGFLGSLVGADGKLPSTLNSRNTDYTVPYGIVRAGQRNAVAAWLATTLFQHCDKPDHFLWATDDRYHCHYIFASVVRAIPWADRMLEPHQPDQTERLWLPGCGYHVFRSSNGQWTGYVGARKGGLVRIHLRDAPPLVDHGYRITQGRTVRTTNWWTHKWHANHHNHTTHISGSCHRAAFHVSSPLKHVALRLLAFGLHERLVPILKWVMIFRPSRWRGPDFQRTVRMEDRGVEIIDKIGPCPGGVVCSGPRQNLRHVASADSFSLEEVLQPLVDQPPHPLDSQFQRTTRWDGSP